MKFFPVICAVTLSAAVFPLGAQSTALTYQGVLQHGPGGAQGHHDVAFSLFASSAGGTPTHSQTNLNVAVSNGLFTTTLVFRPDQFDGKDRWLEIAVRPSAGGSSFVTLNPRQLLTATVFALRAASITDAALPPSLQFIEFVAVGHPVNPPDTRIMSDGTTGYGRVTRSFEIGKYEVTNEQYVRFLNAVARDDPNQAYNELMDTTAFGGIRRYGSPGSYHYVVKKAMRRKPVNFVDFWDALRFCNWLHNGMPSGAQGFGTTEGGAYTLTPDGIAANDITRNPGARYFLPSEDQWYKAAYYDPSKGASGGYWLYPTQNDTEPVYATADAIGNIDNDTLNIANVNNTAIWNGENGNVTTVGSGGPGSGNFYGAADMGGNVWEWNDTIITLFGSARGLRGSSLGYQPKAMKASERNEFEPYIQVNDVGFRVARETQP